MEKVCDLAFKLHDLLLNSDEYKTLKNMESVLYNDSLSFNLLNEYHKMQEEYAFNKTDEMLKQLHLVKLK